MNGRTQWSRILVSVGSIAMLVGALDLMEGSLLILPGSALVALGAFIGQSERKVIAYRTGVFIMIAIGVGAMWGLTSVGGFGGHSGHSMWWGLLMLPYLVGWSMGIWGPGSPRWLLVLGICVGLFLLALVPASLSHGREHAWIGATVISVLGVTTIAGCIIQLYLSIHSEKPLKGLT